MGIHCGMLLRSCARHPQLVEAFLAQPDATFQLISFTQHKSFDISSDAFSALREILLAHTSVSAAFLEANFQEFFKLYHDLLQSDDYVTQRQALKLLSEILLDRAFMRVMLAYVTKEHFLQIHMNLLRANSKKIQVEAFHVFKIFVANPQKPPRVQQILFKNKHRLVKLLDSFQDKGADEQFANDNSAIIRKLQVMNSPAKNPPSMVVAEQVRPQ